MNGFLVADKRCSECLYSKNKVVSDARKTELATELKDTQQHFICHKATLNSQEICCRGFYDEHGHESQLIRIAQRLKVVQFVPLPAAPELLPYRKHQRISR